MLLTCASYSNVSNKSELLVDGGFGENVWQFITHLCFFFFFFLFKVEISLPTLTSLSRQGSVHSGSASWYDCDQVFLMSCVWARFPDTLCQDRGTVSPLRLCWVKGVWMFRCNLPPALLAEWPGSFKCHCCNTGGGTDTEWESAHKVDSGEENCPAAPARIWTRNLSIPSPPL